MLVRNLVLVVTVASLAACGEKVIIREIIREGGGGSGPAGGSGGTSAQGGSGGETNGGGSGGIAAGGSGGTGNGGDGGTGNGGDGGTGMGGDGGTGMGGDGGTGMGGDGGTGMGGDGGTGMGGDGGTGMGGDGGTGMGGGGGTGMGGGGGVVEAAWTVLVYLQADGDLEASALAELDELVAVGSTDEVHLIVQVDRASGFSADAVGGIADFRTTKRLRVLDGELDELDDLGETNMGNATTLSEFVSWGLQQYPARRTALLLRDRGAGWPGIGADASTASADGLTLAELDRALVDALDEAGVAQLDLLGLDASVMATWEVVSTLAPFGAYLLASQEVMPGHGWDYAALSALTLDPETTARDLGLAVLGAVEDHAAAASAGETVTLALFDLSEVPALDRAIGDLAADVENDGAAAALPLARARRLSMILGGNSIEGAGPGLVDLRDLLVRLADADAAWAAHADAVDLALADAVVSKVAGRAMAGASGLSIYFPVQAGLRDEGYADVTAAADWSSALDAFFAAAEDEDAPSFTNENGVASYTLEEGDLILWGDLDADTSGSVAGATLLYGTSVDETILGLGDDRALFDDSQAAAAWNLTYLTLFDDEQAAFAYASWSLVNDDVVTLTVPLIHQSDDGAREASAFLYAVYERGGDLLESRVYELGARGLSELVPRADSTLRPIILRQSEGSWGWIYSSAEGFDPLDPDLGLGFSAFDEGDPIYAQIQLENAAGAVDLVYVWGTL